MRDISHIKDDTPIDLYQIEILHRLQTDGPMSFERIFESRTNRAVMVGLFLALLELIREKLVSIDQPTPSTIYIRPLTDEPAEQAVQKAIIDVEATYNVPSQSEQQKETAVPIVELPPEKKQPSIVVEPENEEIQST